MGDVDLVWVRCFQWKGRDVFTLARESTPVCWLTAADVRDILGDEPPVIAYDDSGPGGALIFPIGSRTAVMLRDQLNDALREAATLPCPAESFPEPGVDADDFAEPPGGESARVEREEAAHLDALRAAALLAPDAVAHHRYAGWAPGDRFIVLDPDDVARHASALHLWPTWGGKAAGTVITRCDRHHDGHDVSAGLLIDCEGLPRPIVVSPRVLSACARKVL
jgi:hypothetical protein